MSASTQFPEAQDQRAQANLPLQPGDDLAVEPPPPPHPAILLGLAFGASAGLLTALYLLFF
ncbi:hypothetical protein [Desertibaculum subflavum]|uniref:hypothetical protein n=1 Tax=Desertibaculum subflavum TaxID=2268458 RepID=UPI000E66536F